MTTDIDTKWVAFDGGDVVLRRPTETELRRDLLLEGEDPDEYDLLQFPIPDQDVMV